MEADTPIQIIAHADYLYTPRTLHRLGAEACEDLDDICDGWYLAPEGGWVGGKEGGFPTCLASLYMFYAYARMNNAQIEVCVAS